MNIPDKIGATVWLRLEGLMLLAVCVALYFHIDASWWLFAGLFLVPDLSFAAYWIAPRAGMLAYNLTHTEVGPALLALVGLVWMPSLLPIALIWGAHVGWDRMLGYGLKLGTNFNQTHLGPVGKARHATPSPILH